MIEKSICIIENQQCILTIPSSSKEENNFDFPTDTLKEDEDFTQAVFRLVLEKAKIDVRRLPLTYYGNTQSSEEKVFHIFYVNLENLTLFSEEKEEVKTVWIKKANIKNCLSKESQHCFKAFCGFFKNSEKQSNSLQNRVIINLFGTVGSGKGSQGKKLSEKYQFTAISLGDLYREECKLQSPIGKLIELFHRTYGDTTFAPNEIAYGILLKKLSQIDLKRVIFDGFPRTLEQSKVYKDGLLSESDTHIPILFSIEDKDVHERLKDRFICPDCNKQVRGHDNLVKKGFCPDCDVELVKRKEDEKEKIDKRLKFFKEQIPPIITSIALRDPVIVLHTDNDVGVDDVFQVIDNVIQKKVSLLSPKKEDLNVFLKKEIEKRTSEFFDGEIKGRRLNSYSNENYLVESKEGKRVVRLPGKYTNSLVDRNAEYANYLILEKNGLSPIKILYFDTKDGFQISEFLENSSPITPEDFSKENLLEDALLLLKKIHLTEVNFTNVFDPFARLEKIWKLLQEQNESLFSSFTKEKKAMDEFFEIFKNSSCFELKPCHNDPVPSNFIKVGDKIELLDWEYAGKNDPAFDLSYLATILNLDEEGEKRLVKLYSSNDEELTLAKMTFFKPLIHLTIGVWMSFVSLKELSEQQLKKYSEAWESDALAEAIKRLSSN